MAKIEIIPSLLTSSPQELRQLIRQAEGEVNRVHVDIIDGVYANNKTIDPSVLGNIDTNLLIDFHLMVDDPVNWVERCIRAGADRIVAQIEMMGDQVEFVEKVTQAGVGLGLALDLNSDVNEIDETILGSLDNILVMSVQAGFGGQEFHKEALDKIDELDRLRRENGYTYTICDDGGITIEWIDDIRREGADEAVVGRRLFKGNLGQNVEEFEESSEI